MLLKRIITAAIFIPIFIFLILKGGFFFLGLVCAVICCGLIEFNHGIYKDSSYIPLRDIFLGLTIPISVYFMGEDILPFTITIVIFVVFFWQLFKMRAKEAQINITFSLSGILYISYLFSYVVILRNMAPIGTQLVITVFFATWMGDTGAFMVGKILGKHRLFPNYSPHKSVEGFCGAVFFSLIAMLISKFWNFFSLKHLIILGILMGVGGEAGDFFESMLKRSLGIKDFGKLLPGHGGILDRFDSLFFTVPIFFYYVKYFVVLEKVT